MTGETDTEIPETGAVFTFGKSKIANNVPSRLWLKNDIPVHISCGQSHSAFVTEQGRLFVFGNNNRGQLGLQIKGPVNKPTCVKVLKGERAQFVACGTDHTLVSTSQGEIFAAGGNSDGQLGLGHCNDSISFQRLHPFCDYAPIKLLSAGDHTSAALTEDGRLFLWGDNSVGQLGLGNDSHALLPKELKLGQSIQWVSCGYRHSALVTDNGDVFTFGESADGRLGLSADQLANHSHPQRVESLNKVLQVACGGKHTLALTEGELYSFGRGEFGQLGLGTLMFLADTPVAVGHFRKGRVTYVTCGENHSALITDSGLLYTFGDGRHGKLGLGDENFTNQFSPTVCQRFFDYSVMTVACGSSHMLVFARPRQQESEEVCLEDEDVTYSYLDRCYTSMLQGQPLEHIPDPAPALVSPQTFLPSSLPTSHRWSLSTRARRRQRESSSAQFGPEFCSLPPPTTSFTALALTGNILQPRSPTDTPKRFRTEAFVESASTSITLPARTTSLTQITKNEEDCHSVGTSENSISDKTHEENKHFGMVENIPQQAPPTKVQAGSVSHSSVTESPPSTNLKNKKPRSGDPKNPAMAEEHSSVTASRSKMQSKKPIKSTKNKSKSQAVEVRLSSDRISAKEKEGSNETCSTNIDPRDKISKADKHSKVQHADSRGQEVTALAEMEKKTKSSPTEIQKTFSRSSSVQEVEQVRTMPTKVQEVKFTKIKEMGIPVGATKRVKSPVKVQNVPSGAIEVSKVESTPQADAQRDIKPSLRNTQEVRSTLINTQEQGNSTPVKIPAKMQSTPKKGKEKNDVDTEESPNERTPKKAKKKRSNVERALMSETAPKTPSPLSVSIPTRISKAKKGKPLETKHSNFQLKHAMPAQEKLEIKRENYSKIPQNSDISFPPIKNQKSGGTAEKSQSASNLQSDQKNSQSPTDKVLTEQKHEFPSIKSLVPERGHSFSSLWSNNRSATNKSSATKETESSSGKLLSPSSSSPQYKQSPLKENKFVRKTVEPEEPDRKPQAEQSIMGSVVSSLPAMAIASAAPLLIKAAEVLSETQPEPSIEMSSHPSVSKETTESNILLEQEVDQDSTVQDASATEEMDDSIIKQQSEQDEQNELVSKENKMLVSGDGKTEEEEHVKDSETERKEEGGEEESLAEEEDELEGVGQEEENSAVEDEEERESENYEDRGESAQQGEEENEEEEAKEEGSEAAGEEEDDSNNGQSSKSEGEMTKGEESGDETEREEGEQSEGQEKEESEEGETDQKEEEDEESGGEDKEEERESWDEGSERKVEDEEKTDAEEEQEGESSNEEKTDEQSESANDKKNERSDEEEGESEEKDESEEEEEENETVEGEGEQEEKGEEEREEEEEVGNEDEDENQEEQSDHEEEESRDQTKEEEEEEEEENNEEEEGEEDKEEEVDEEENNEELKDKKDGVTNKSEEEESVREKEENEVEAEDEEKMSDGDEDREKQEGKEQSEEEDGEKEEDKKEGEMNTGEEKFREEENVDILETQETERGDEDDETEKLNEMEEENEEESGHEEEEEEIDQKKENKTTERSQRKQRETNEEEEEGGEEVEEEEEEETEQKNKNIKTKKNRKKQRETSEEKEEQEEESEEEEEETEQEEKNIKTEKNRRKPRETSEEEEEEEEESEEEEEESEQEEKNIKTEKNRRKQRESSEEEEEQEEESEEQEEEIEQKENNIRIETSEEEEEQSEGDEEEEEEEETEHKEKNNKKDKDGSDEEEEQEEEGEEEEEEEEKTKVSKQRAKKNERKRRETSEEEDEQEEETEEEEEGEEQEGEEEEGEEEEEEEEEEKTKVQKQRAKPDVLPPRRQTNAQRDRQKTRHRHQQNVKGKKQTDSGAQDPQFWNNVLPQYLNLK